MTAASARISLALVLVGAAALALPSLATAHHPPDQHFQAGQAVFLEETPMMDAVLPAEAELTSLDCENGMAGPYECDNVDLESFLPLTGIGTGNDIWGWTDPEDGSEYAIIGSALATSFVDVSDPENPVLLGELPSASVGAFVLWRDIKVIDNHAFIVSEIGGHGMQVFDLTKLRDSDGSPPEVFGADAVYRGGGEGESLGNVHNIATSETPEGDFAYAIGSNTCDEGEGEGGLHMIDVSEPENPQFAGCAGEDGYVHDVQCVAYDGPDQEFQGREICFGSNEDSVTIYDTTDKTNPVILSRTEYPTAAYTHQGWLTADKGYFVFGDELDEGVASDPTREPTVDGTTTYIMRVDDLREPGAPKAHTAATESIDHNLYIDDGLIYQSNYSAGLRVQDFDNESLEAGRLSEVGFFDVFPGSNVNDFVGTWSNYPFFDSGIVVVSAIESQQSSLFVLRPQIDGDDEGEDPPDGGGGPPSGGDDDPPRGRGEDRGRGRGGDRGRGDDPPRGRPDEKPGRGRGGQRE